MPTIFPIGVDGKKDIRDLLRPVIKKRLACVIVDKNEDRGLRHQAINAASVSADPKAISPLVTCLCDEKEETGIREAAALALGSLLSEIPYAEGSNAALGILQGIAQFERDDELQAAANKALEDYERNKVSAVTSEDQIPITGYYVVSSYYPVDIEYMRGAVRTGDIKIQSDMSIAIGFGTDNPPKSVREALEKIADYVIKLRQEYQSGICPAVVVARRPRRGGHTRTRRHRTR